MKFAKSVFLIGKFDKQKNLVKFYNGNDYVELVKDVKNQYRYNSIEQAVVIIDAMKKKDQKDTKIYEAKSNNKINQVTK